MFRRKRKKLSFGLSFTGACEESVAAVDYWIAKILVERGGWFRLERNYSIRKPAERYRVLPGTEVGAVISDLLSQLVQKIIDSGRFEDDEEPKTFEEFEDELPDEVSRAYEELRKKLGREGEDVPQELFDFYQCISDKVKTSGLFPEKMQQNAAVLQECLRLSSFETDMLFFLLLIQANPLLKEVINFFDFTNKGIHMLGEMMAWLFDVSVTEVMKVISPEGRLVNCGVLTLNSYPSDDAQDLFEVFHNNDLNQYIWGTVTKKKLFSQYLIQTEPSVLSLKDFNFLPAIPNIILPFLKQNASNPRKGVNILLYGPPGTGKTELSRLLAKESGLKAFEPSLSTSGKSSESTSRWKNWQVASSLLSSSSDSLLAVDEAADLFNEGIQKSYNFRTNKAFINKCLEENQTPTIWMTNSIAGLDPAMIRRFTFVLEVANPPLRALKDITHQKLGKFLDEKELTRLTKSNFLSPGLITQVAEILETFSKTSMKLSSKVAMEIITEKLKAQGLPKLPPIENNQSYLYDPDLTNSMLELKNIAEGVKRAGSAKICIYGPPGTGKTAYAKWLAKYLEKPLIVRKASNLLNCYLGETEKIIAQAFEDAQRDDAVLLLDEIDSFLRDRTLSSHSWEVTQVNELLTQIENFEGVFIATTNLIDLLDPAALRRFDLKTKFDFLKPEQAKKLFKKYSSQLRLQGSLAEVLAELEDLEKLTPGDFAAVYRQFKFRTEKTKKAFFEALKDEVRIKGNGGAVRKIGFS
ncbi:AAA family ATPase [uncultured Turicimonas sp.]|uniref:AAA family ATPase n=1 Tax=uncultured Turicimonas sp. TaxID=1918607 RepID=UPI0028055ED8|nr:AAA family ATPase [uncultured Turicimonas sp.]